MARNVLNIRLLIIVNIRITELWESLIRKKKNYLWNGYWSRYPWGIIKTNVHKMLVIIYTDYSKPYNIRNLRRFNNFKRNKKKIFLRWLRDVEDVIKTLWLLSVSSLNIDLRRNFFNIKTNNIVSRNKILFLSNSEEKNTWNAI